MTPTCPPFRPAVSWPPPRSAARSPAVAWLRDLAGSKCGTFSTLVGGGTFATAEHGFAFSEIGGTLSTDFEGRPSPPIPVCQIYPRRRRPGRGIAQRLWDIFHKRSCRVPSARVPAASSPRPRSAARSPAAAWSRERSNFVGQCSTMSVVGHFPQRISCRSVSVHRLAVRQTLVGHLPQGLSTALSGSAN